MWDFRSQVCSNRVDNSGDKPEKRVGASTSLHFQEDYRQKSVLERPLEFSTNTQRKKKSI